MRQSVDVLRLSRIAGNNLEREGEAADYPAAQAGAGDVTIDSADAELDFEEGREEGECAWQGRVWEADRCWRDMGMVGGVKGWHMFRWLRGEWTAKKWAVPTGARIPVV